MKNKDYNSLEDDLAIRNVELAAGIGDFGRRFFAPCYLTDAFTSGANIDFVCDALHTPFADNRFDVVIICNPYRFGFSDDNENDAQNFLKEMTRILTDCGKLVVIGNNKNKYCKLRKVQEEIEKFQQQNPNIVLSLGVETLDEASYSGYIFHHTDGIKRTFPDKQITISIHKHL